MADYTRAWDIADPADSDLAKFGAQEIREFKVDIAERLAREHLAGNLVTDAFGMHAFINKALTSADSPYTVLKLQTVLLCDTTAGSITLNLPTAVGLTGKPYVIKKTVLANVLTIDPNGAETIGGYATMLVKEIKQITIMSDGSNWLVIDAYGPEVGYFHSPYPYRNLLIKPTAGSTYSSLDISFDECILKGPQGDYIKHLAGSGVANIAVGGVNGLDTGAEASNTWYYIWAVSSGGVLGFCLSTSSTAPNAAVTGTYPYVALLGAVRNDSGGNFQRMYQRNNRVLLDSSLGYMVVTQHPVVATDVDLGGVAGSVGLCPPIARKVQFSFQLDRTSANGHLVIQTLQDGITYSALPLGPVNSDLTVMYGYFEIQPNSANQIRYYSTNAGMDVSFGIRGWEY